MIQIIIEILFEIFCGWVGRWTVKLFTLGKVDLHDSDTNDSFIAQWIGVIFLLLLAVGTVAVIRHT